MSLLANMTRRARVSVASIAAGGLIAVGAAIIPQSALATVTGSEPSSVQEQSQARAKLSPEKMLSRAESWLTANNGSQVPYSQSQYWSDGYRQDCSGYVSMTLGLSTPGTNTVGLAENRDITTPIAVQDLKPGDLLIDAEGSNTTRHVVIFAGWTDSSKSAYSAYEQRGGHGTDHRVLDYGLDSGSEYKPYRPVKLSGEAPPESPSGDWPSLTSGKQGVDVKAAQYLLSARGYETRVDGDFGSGTAARAKSFQGSVGLQADGVIGPGTWPKLVKEVASGSSGDAVRAAQVQLNEYGHKLRVDGSFGSVTVEAVEAFQKEHELTVDGVVGPQTWKALLGGS